MNFFERRKILKNTNAMDLVPVRAMGHETNEKEIVLLVPKFQSGLMHRIAPRTRYMYYRVKLDDMGSRTWEHIDGERSVQQIADRMREEDGMEKDKLVDLEERLSKFMTLLYERKYITFKQIM